MVTVWLALKCAPETVTVPVRILIVLEDSVIERGGGGGGGVELAVDFDVGVGLGARVGFDVGLAPGLALGFALGEAPGVEPGVGEAPATDVTCASESTTWSVACKRHDAFQQMRTVWLPVPISPGTVSWILMLPLESARNVNVWTGLFSRTSPTWFA